MSPLPGIDPTVAYIDPGTGSYVLQLVAGAILGAVVAVKVYWKKFRSRIARLFRSG